MTAPRGTCLVCDEDQDDLISHLLMMHADESYGGFETWPDGEVVVIDETLEPSDFEELA